MKLMIFVFSSFLLGSQYAETNDSCAAIVKRTVQASFPSQEEYEVSSPPQMVLETDPKTGAELYNTWVVKTNEGFETGGFSITVVTRRLPSRSLNEGCSVVGIF